MVSSKPVYSVLYLCEGVAAVLLHLVFLCLKTDDCGHVVVRLSDQTRQLLSGGGKRNRKECEKKEL